MCIMHGGSFCLILERRQMKRGSISAMVNRVHPMLVLLSWTCTGVIMGWLNCAPGHTSEPRAKSILHGPHPNPLEVASEECAKQGSDISDFDGVCVCVCVLYFSSYCPHLPLRDKADLIVSWYFPECCKSFRENGRKKQQSCVVTINYPFFLLLSVHS